MTHKQLLEKWPSDAEIAEDLGCASHRPRDWKRRNSIPAVVWPSLIASARRRRITGITYEALAIGQSGAQA